MVTPAFNSQPRRAGTIIEDCFTIYYFSPPENTGFPSLELVMSFGTDNLQLTCSKSPVAASNLLAVLTAHVSDDGHQNTMREESRGAGLFIHTSPLSGVLASRSGGNRLVLTAS